MDILMNIIVLIFEVLYYSMFMKFARKEGKFWKYLLLFSLITIVLIFTGTGNLYVYLIFVLLTLYGLKYIVKTKTSLYDMFIIYIMLFVKLIIELAVSYFVYFLIINNTLIVTSVFAVIKIIVLLIMKNKMNLIYNRLKLKWDKNNFYIRYIFVVMNFLYIIGIAIYILYILM